MQADTHQDLQKAPHWRVIASPAAKTAFANGVEEEFAEMLQITNLLTKIKTYSIIQVQFNETEPFQSFLKTNWLIFWNAIMRIAL